MPILVEMSFFQGLAYWWAKEDSSLSDSLPVRRETLKTQLLPTPRLLQLPHKRLDLPLKIGEVLFYRFPDLL